MILFNVLCHSDETTSQNTSGIPQNSSTDAQGGDVLANSDEMSKSENTGNGKENCSTGGESDDDDNITSGILSSANNISSTTNSGLYVCRCVCVM